MAIAKVQDTGIQTGAGVLTDSAALGTITSGNLVVVGVGHWNPAGGAISSVADGLSNTYSRAASGIFYETNQASAEVWYAKNVAGGSCTVTITPTQADTNNYMAWAAVEFSGLDKTSPLDQAAGNFGNVTATDANVTAGAANAQANMLVIAVASAGIYLDTDVAWGAAPSSGYTNLVQYANWDTIESISFDYKIVSAVETSSAAWSHDAANNNFRSGWGAVIATFKAPLYTRLERSTRGLTRGVATGAY